MLGRKKGNMRTMESRLPCTNSSFNFPTYTFPPAPHLTHSVVPTMTSSNPPFSTDTPLVSTVPTSQDSQTYHFGFEDAPFVGIPADSLHDEHNDPYVPSEEDDESEDDEQAGQISNSEVSSFKVIISLIFTTFYYLACR
jgi:hypothetical protein